MRLQHERLPNFLHAPPAAANGFSDLVVRFRPGRRNSRPAMPGDELAANATSAFAPSDYVTSLPGLTFES